MEIKLENKMTFLQCIIPIAIGIFYCSVNLFIFQMYLIAPGKIR